MPADPTLMLQGAYRPPAAARYLAISERALGREYAAGRITPRRHGRCLLYPRPELDRWIESQPKANPADIETPDRHPAQKKGAANG